MLPLEGIKVLSLTVHQQGQQASTILADWGADVVKIEGPESPDPDRFGNAGNRHKGLNPVFETNNRNTRAIVLDLKSEAGREVLYRMVRQADVFVQNMRPGTAERLGAGYAELSKHNPGLVYGTASALGKYGPHSDRPGMDILAQARGGSMSTMGEPGPTDPRARFRGPLADVTGATLLAFGLLLALFHKQRTGEGQEVDGSLLDGQVYLQSWRLSNYLFTGELSADHGLRKRTSPLWNQFRGSDGHWFVIGSNRMKWWPVLCELIGEPGLIPHPAMAVQPPDPDLMPELIDHLEQVFVLRPAAEWVDRMREAGISAEPIQDYTQIEKDPQVLANEMITEFDHPTAGHLRMPAFGVHLSKAKTGVRRAAPEYGQHTEEVLQDYGFGWDELVTLRESGAIGPRLPEPATK